MEFANYFVIRALEHGWNVLKTQPDATWLALMPPGISETEKLRAKTALMSQGIDFRMVYTWALDNSNAHVVACGLQEIASEPDHQNWALDPFEQRSSWILNSGKIGIYVATYNEFMLMLISNIVHCIMTSFVTDGWFLRSGFDHMRHINAQDLHPETDAERPKTAAKYIRNHVWYAKMTTELPHIAGPFNIPVKPIFIADESVAADSILDPTTGEELDLGGTIRGGVSRP